MASILDINGTWIVFGLLGFFLAAQFLLGGVILDHDATEAGFRLKIRDAEPQWQEATTWRYWRLRFSSILHSILIGGGLAIAVAYWLRKVCRNEQQ